MPFIPFSLDVTNGKATKQNLDAEVNRVVSEVEAQIASAALGIQIVETVAEMEAFYSDPDNQGRLVMVTNNNNNPRDPANGVYEYVNGAPRLSTMFIDTDKNSYARSVPDITARNQMLSRVYGLHVYVVSTGHWYVWTQGDDEAPDRWVELPTLDEISGEAEQWAEAARVSADRSEGFATALEVYTAGGWFDSIEDGAATVPDGEGYFVVDSDGRFLVAQREGSAGVVRAEFSTTSSLHPAARVTFQRTGGIEQTASEILSRTPIDVREYPTVTAAIQAAQTQLRPITTSGEIVILNETVTIIGGGPIVMVNAKFTCFGSLEEGLFDFRNLPLFHAEGCDFDANGESYAWLKLWSIAVVVIRNCGFKDVFAASTAFGLWLRDGPTQFMIEGCTLDGAVAPIPRLISIQNATGPHRGSIFNCTLRNVAGTTDGDAIVCESYDYTDNFITVEQNIFSNIHKRAVKAGGSGWLIHRNILTNVGGGAGYSLFSFYGSSDFTLENNITIGMTGQISYAIDIGGGESPDAANVAIRDNKFYLFNYTSGTQDFLRCFGDVVGLDVSGNEVNHCRHFYSHQNGGNLKTARFERNHTIDCRDHEFNMGNADIDGFTVDLHRSDAYVPSRALVSALGTVKAATLTNNSYDKGTGLIDLFRPTTAYGNYNAGVLEAEMVFSEGLIRGRRNSHPTSGSYIVGDQFDYITPLAGGFRSMICVAVGSPGTWKDFAGIEE